MVTGIISNIQKFCLHDGPGIRTTVFLKGCPLSCKWCHNPEMISATPELHQTESRCIRCGTCIEVCPENIAAITVGINHTCRLCGTCIAHCPTGARQLNGATVSVAYLLEKITRERLLYDESGGGVTFSGGEPLQQPAFLLTLLQACHQNGVHTAVDTCGYGPFSSIKKIAAYTDLFLYDIKLIDNKKHIHWTGVSNKLILENLQQLSRIHNNIWIRIPIIPGLNDTGQELNNMAQFLSSLSGIQQVNLLPYHQTGSYKQRSVNHGEWFTGCKSLLKDEIKPMREAFLDRGLRVIIGG
jgi:pyruvate formate lyase activating enzyme